MRKFTNDQLRAFAKASGKNGSVEEIRSFYKEHDVKSEQDKGDLADQTDAWAKKRREAQKRSAEKKRAAAAGVEVNDAGEELVSMPAKAAKPKAKKSKPTMTKAEKAIVARDGEPQPKDVVEAMAASMTASGYVLKHVYPDFKGDPRFAKMSQSEFVSLAADMWVRGGKGFNVSKLRKALTEWAGTVKA